TEDVTRTWESSDAVFVQIGLTQNGQKVTGAVLRPKHLAGPIDGVMAGDGLRFQRTGGTFEGKMTVSGDEMSGTLRAITGRSGYGSAITGTVEGDVAGDQFRFQQTGGTNISLPGEMTVGGDEMSGAVRSVVSPNARHVLRRGVPPEVSGPPAQAGVVP